MKGIRKLMLVGLAALCLQFGAQAQIQPGSFGYYEDALRFSQLNNFGSARILGLGGSGSVLGGDVSSAILNPAGLGFYNRSQFVLTPGFNFNQFESTYLLNDSRTEDSNLNIANLGLIINFNKSDYVPGGWRGGSLAITFNRVNDFRQQLSYSGQGIGTSIIDAMLDRADLFFPEELGGIEQVGYDHFLINPLPGAEDFYLSPVAGNPIQRERINRTGFTDQINIAFGGNYDDKIYLGAGIGILSTNYTSNRIYTEEFSNTVLSSFTLDERFDVSGTGFNANIGVIVRPVDFVRFGVSLTSPTWYNFSEESDAIYNSEWNNFDASTFLDNGNRVILEDTVLNSLQTQTNIFFSDYELRTPLRFNAGVAFFLGKNGFITADYERLNYGSANVSSADFIADNDNETIRNNFESVNNLRLGAEYRYKIFRFRAGYAMLGDPTNGRFNTFSDVDRSRTVISGGVGLNLGKYFLDFSYSQTRFEESFTSFSFADSAGPTSITETTLNNARISFGLNF
ncbi:hypothetical protein BFP97_00325 [Roseivirga sp. 4D4]|uniref:OmpP1/FadL family transporter n=1 Tax=Roseivirga sp. 4D4 TaxID=1889784 RepID=UPI000852B0D3|nr:hypothetical protein [Roseivirga sp. 4D4]OEK00051.1 hypothetical protein BFP97_00325 [Roseivirga sp. 4D4]